MLKDDRLSAIHILFHDGVTRADGCPDDLGAVRDWFHWGAWSALPMVAAALEERSNVGVDGSGFRFEAEPDEEPFEGVEIYTPLDTAYLPEDTFVRLVGELLLAARDGLTAAAHPVTRAPWWPGFVERVGHGPKRRDPCVGHQRS